MALNPFIRFIVGPSRFPRQIGQELPDPVEAVKPVEIIKSEKRGKPKVEKDPKPSKSKP